MTGGWDAFTLPEQPVASGVRRPRALFASPATVIGLRAGSVTVAGSLTRSKIAAFGDIGAVKIGEGASDSLIAAGVDAGDGQLGNGNEAWNGNAKKIGRAHV